MATQVGKMGVEEREERDDVMRVHSSYKVYISGTKDWI